MSSSKAIQSVSDCMEWVTAKQRQNGKLDLLEIQMDNFYLKATVRDIPLVHNHIAIEQSLASLRDNRTQIDEFTQIVEALKKKRGNIRDVRVLEDAFLQLYDLALQKKRSLEALLYITETETVFQTLQNEVEKRALYLSERKVVFDSVYRTQDSSAASRLHRVSGEFVTSLRQGWDWLSDVTKCLDMHVKNGATYHQGFWNRMEKKLIRSCRARMIQISRRTTLTWLGMFFHDVQYMDHDMSQYTLWAQKVHAHHNVKKRTATIDVINFIKDATSQLLDFNARLDRLSEESHHVYPIPLRKDSEVENKKVMTLVGYNTNDLNLEANETLTLIDNTNEERWTVRGDDGSQGDIPSILVVIPPPCAAAVDHISRLQEQMSSHYAYTVDIIKEVARDSTAKFAKDTKSKEYQLMSGGQCADVLTTVNQCMDTMVTDPCHSMQEGFVNILAAVRRVVCQCTNPSTSARDTKTVRDWKQVAKINTMIQDLCAYHTEHEGIKNRTHSRSQAVVLSEGNPPQYASKAYFEKMKNVEVTYDKRPGLISVKDSLKSDIFIHERNRGIKSDELPVNSTPQSQQALQKIVNDQIEKTPDMTRSDPTKHDNKRFGITGVIDICTGNVVTVDEADGLNLIDLKEGTYRHPVTMEVISLERAVNLGLVKVQELSDSDTGDDSDVCFSGLVEQSDVCVTGVVDPKSGDLVSLDEASSIGAIDTENGVYVNPVTGITLPIEDAIKKGFIVLDSNFPLNSIEGLNLRFVSRDKWLSVEGVIDPVTKQTISVKRAELTGVLDKDRGVYRNPSTGEEIPMDIAIKQGLIKAVDVDKDTEGDLIIAVPVTTLEGVKVLSAQLDEKPDTIDGKIDSNNQMFGRLPDNLKTQTKGIKDPLDQYTMTVGEAFDMGVLKLDTAMYDTLDGEVIPLPEATARGLLTPSILKDLLKVYQEQSLQELTRQGIYDPDTGLVTDPYSGKSLALDAAIDQGLIEADKVYFYDLSSGQIRTLGSAIEDGSYDPKTGMFMLNGKGPLSLRQAQEMGLIDADVDPDKLSERAEALSILRPLMDTDKLGVYSPFTKKKISIEDAVNLGILDLTKALYVDDDNHTSMSLNDAINDGKIDQETAKEILDTLAKLSLENVIKQGKLNPVSGSWKKSTDSVPVSFAEAIDRDYVNPQFVYFTDKETGAVTTLDSAIHDGKFDPKTGKFMDQETFKKYSIADAIKRGSLDPTVDPVSCMNQPTPLKALIDSGKVAPTQAMFLTPNGRRLSIRDAMADGFLTMASQVKVDRETGCVVLASDEDVVTSLMDVKDHLDWLETMEQELVNEGRPSESLDVLTGQHERAKEIEEEIHAREADVKKAMKLARDLLDRNATHLKDGTNQQLQKLNQTTTDLGVRFEDAQTEAENRASRLEDMVEDCTNYRDGVDEINHELDAIQLQANQSLSSNLPLPDQSNQYQDLLKELEAKEGAIADVTSTSNKFQNDCQDFQKDLIDYRKRLQLSPLKPPRSVSLSAMQNDRDELEKKYREIMKECGRNVENLQSIIDDRDEFGDLCEKLDMFYPAIEAKIHDKKSMMNGSVSPQMAADKIENLKNLKSTLTAQDKTLDHLSAIADRLSQNLGDLNKINEASDVTKKAQELQKRHKALKGDIAAEQEDMADMLSQSENTTNQVDVISAWLDTIEQEVMQQKAISADKDVLLQQIENQRDLSSELAAKKLALERIARESKDIPGLTRRVDEQRERITKLEEASEEFTRDLDHVSTDVNDLENCAERLNTWLDDTINTFRKKLQDSDKVGLKNKVNEYYDQKRSKEETLQSMKDTCERVASDPSVNDSHAPKQLVAVVQSKWHDLTELLVQQVSLQALTEIDGMLKYLDKAENEINTAEPVSVDPDTLGVQLRDHSAFNEDLHNKRNSVKDIINKCNGMLRETTNSQTDEIKNRLDSIRNQADIVCQLSDERLNQLDDALPLASHFSENQSELTAWLDEMEAELNAQMPSGDSLDQVKKQQDSLKGTLQIIEDHKPFIEDLNTTGVELMEICGDEDAGEVHEKLYAINLRYDELKKLARQKADDLTEAKKNMNQEVSETVDSLLEEMCQLNRKISHCDPVPSSPDKLKDDIEENKFVIEEAKKKQPTLEKVSESVNQMVSQGVEELADVEDLNTKILELRNLYEGIEEDGTKRDKSLGDALKISERLYDACVDVSSVLTDLKDNVYSQEPPGVDVATVKEQMKELQDLKNELTVKCWNTVDACHQAGESLTQLCGETGKIEVRRNMEDVDNLYDDVRDVITERENELNAALAAAEKFEQAYDSILSWLPISEHRFGSLKSPGTDANTLTNQTQELKMFKMQVHPRQDDMHTMNTYFSTLKDMSPVAADSIQKPVVEVNQRWNDLLYAISARENILADCLLRSGDIDSCLDDVISNLTQCAKDIGDLNTEEADPKAIEGRLKKLQMTQTDIKNQDAVVRKLNKMLGDLEQENPELYEQLQDRQKEMNDLLRETQIDSVGKQNDLQEVLTQMKKYVGEIDDLSQWVNDLKLELKSPKPLGSLPDSAKKQWDEFTEREAEFDEKEKELTPLIEKGAEIVEKCPPEESARIGDKLKRLRTKIDDTKRRMNKRKDKMREHRGNVDDFHSTLKGFNIWLGNAEVTLRGFVYPSKIVPKVLTQITEHNTFREDVLGHSEMMDTLDKTGTYVKYFGRKQDTIYIKNLLVGIRLRWKKLLRRVDERGRLLQQAHKEDKRFYDAWKSLCEWLDQSERKLNRILSMAQAPSKVKNEIEEIKDDSSDSIGSNSQQINEIKTFQQELTTKHPAFYSTTRLGRNLKDRCTRTDPDKETLQGMLDDLKNKWNYVRTIVSKSQNKLDEALLSSGRVSDAVNSLFDWLQKTEASLSEDQPVLGDVDTVNILIEQNRALQQELVARESTLATMRSSGSLPPGQIEELSSLWEKVNQLSEARETRLQESLRLAEDFQEVVQIMREFLPQAEGELKVKGLPEDEMVILNLMDRHDKFQGDLASHQGHVDKIKGLAEEILMNCHPNAVRFVKYYLTITQTRWDQILARAKSRGERLEDALRSIQGNAALLEELLTWLTDAQVLLATKERDPIPDDLKVVEELVNEHLELHEEVTSKNADVDRLTKVVSSEFAKFSQGKNYGSNWKLNEIDGQNPRVLALQNKWRIVWRMSVERKKRLQDALEELLELESFKNFDFELWRQRYMNWITAKKFRISDFFRRQDKDCDGCVTREEFVNGMLQSKFPTNRTELCAVFDMFDHVRQGRMQYQEFIDALRPDKLRRNRPASRASTDAELIHEEIEKSVSICQCRRSFKADKIDEGKYKFGENHVKLVRYLNSCVMVRVGGGWITLDKFLSQNDPCRAKGRTNMDLRSTLSPNTTYSSPRRASTSGTSRPTTPGGRPTTPSMSSRPTTPGRPTTPSMAGRPTTPSFSSTPARGSRKQPDTGYASSNSSGEFGSSNLSNARRNQVTTSLINLSDSNPQSPRSPQASFNDAVNNNATLNKSKRLSSSSQNLTPDRLMRGIPPKVPPVSSTRPRTPSFGASRTSTARSNVPPRSITPTPGSRPSTNPRRTRPTTPVVTTPTRR